jgi:hypothetical protein
MELERLTFEEWADALPKTGFEVFHTPEMLSVLDDHASGDLRLYGGFKGQQAVALLPVFVRRTPLAPDAVLSPPPGMGVPYLGPILMPASPKQKKQERLNRKFVDAVLEDIDVEESRTMLRMLAGPGYDDPRPFIWSDVEPTPRFTYRVDLEDKSMDDVMGQFSKSMRYEMRKGRDLDVTVERGGIDAARKVYADVAERFEEQGTDSNLTWGYLRDVFTRLDDRVRVYAARDPDGSYLSGIFVLYSNDTAYYWQGGARASYDNISVNNVLHHRILKDAVEDPPFESITSYDLVGANTERLCSYKAQFGGDLVRYYLFESDDAVTKLAKQAYQLFDRTGLKG